MITKEQCLIAVKTVQAIADAIRELRSVPSAELYARVMPYISLDNYERILGILKRSGVVEERAHVLYWVAPPAETEIGGYNDPRHLPVV